jgi:hypothetical protein
MTVSRAEALAIENGSTKVTIIAAFTALALATNYALIGIPNVKIMDTLVFIAAFSFGLQVGIGVAVSIWPIYGFVNPYGVDSFLMLSFLMIGECFYALAGLGLRKTFIAQDLASGERELRGLSVTFGLAGLLATFAYDILTNFGSWIFKTGSLYRDFIYGNIVGAPFSLAHEASNVVFFATVAPAIIVAVTRLGVRVPRGLP